MKEGNVLFNDALNTFYLRVYCAGKKNTHSHSERGNLLPLLLFSISSKGYAPFHIQDSTYHGFFIPVVEHWLEREMAHFFKICITYLFNDINLFLLIVIQSV